MSPPKKKTKLHNFLPFSSETIYGLQNISFSEKSNVRLSKAMSWGLREEVAPLFA